MARPRRIQFTDAIYLVSNHCLAGWPLLEPSDELNEIVRNLLAWTADIHGVRLHGFVFLPRCFYMLLGAPHLNLEGFMERFQGILAKRVNALRGRSGQFFAGRYEDTHVQPDMLVEELVRLNRLPCSAGLVEHPSDWSGVSSYALHESGKPLEGTRTSLTQAREIRRAHPNLSEAEARALATTHHAVDLARLPEFVDETHMGYHREILARVNRFLDDPVDSDDASHELDFNDTTTVEQAPTYTPRKPRVRGRPPRILTRSVWRRQRLADTFRALNLAYDNARARLRRNRGKPCFPEGMIPLHKRRAVGSTVPPKLQRARSGDAAA